MPDDLTPPVESGQGDEQTAPDFRPWIPEPYRTEKLWETVPDLPTLTKNYVEAQKMIGGSVRIPKDDAPPEEWQKFYTKMGRPETPDGYQVQLPDMPQGLTVDDEALKGFKALAHAEGFSPKQLNSVLKWFYGEYIPGQSKNFDAQYDAAEQSLKGKWGEAYDNNLGLVKRTITSLANDELLQEIHDSGLGNSVNFVEWVLKVGKNLVEDGIIPETHQGGVGREHALQKIAELTKDPKGPYMDWRHPDHDRAVEEVRKLHEIAYN